jgi:hypothetical protein
MLCSFYSRNGWGWKSPFSLIGAYFREGGSLCFVGKKPWLRHRHAYCHRSRRAGRTHAARRPSRGRISESCVFRPATALSQGHQTHSLAPQSHGICVTAVFLPRQPAVRGPARPGRAGLESRSFIPKPLCSLDKYLRMRFNRTGHPPHAMSPHSLKARIAAGALAFTLVVTVLVVVRFSGAGTQPGGLGLNLPSLLSLPLVALPFLPGLLAP